MAFYVGQKVVCIKDTRPYYAMRPGHEIHPVLNEVYTVRGVYFNPILHIEALWLHEIKNEPINYSDGFVECNFHVAWFRPAAERKTDISIFTKMLDREKVPA